VNTWDQRWDSACDEIHALYAERDALKAENERLREALKLAAVDLAIIDHMFGGGKTFERILTAIGEALAGSRKSIHGHSRPAPIREARS